MKFKTLITLSILVFGNLSTAQTDVIFYSSFERLNKLNDTGMTFGGDFPYTNNFYDYCISNISAPQDCHQGRDATHPDNSDGHGGFSFTKLDASGNPLADQSVDYETTPWACIQDNVTGLVWEVKTYDGGGGLHDADQRYTWYNTDNRTNGGNPAAPGGQNNGTAQHPTTPNTCYGYNAAEPATFCNTEAYTARVNAQNLCGQTDWRLPDINELHSIVLHHGRDTMTNWVSPAIDINYFPNTFGVYDPDDHQPWFDRYYWSSTPASHSFSSGETQAWSIIFAQGLNNTRDSHEWHYVRLVRGGQ